MNSFLQHLKKLLHIHQYKYHHTAGVNLYYQCRCGARKYISPFKSVTSPLDRNWLEGGQTRITAIALDIEHPVTNLTLHTLLAQAIGEHENFGDDHLQTLITVGKGMFWSKELDQAARALAEQVEEEFDRFGNTPGDE